MTRSQQLACVVGLLFLSAGSLYLAAFRDVWPMAVAFTAVVLLIVGARA